MALKAPDCGAGGGGSSREDPLRLPAFQRLAGGLPFAKHTQSKLVSNSPARPGPT
jgi:macrophage erythroblast attacher